MRVLAKQGSNDNGKDNDQKRLALYAEHYLCTYITLFYHFYHFFSQQYRQLKEKYESLGRLQKVCENHETEMVQGRAREERQNELRKSLSPRINELEKKLRKLRPGLEKDSNRHKSPEQRLSLECRHDV